MLHKYERYIPKNLPQTALALIQQQESSVKLDYQGEVSKGNHFRLQFGLSQRQNVEPKHLNINLNKERIGVNMRYEIGPKAEDTVHYQASEHSVRRKVMVTQPDINHMQCTPMKRKGYSWTITFQTLGYFRDHSMLWGRCSDDPYHRWSNKGEIKCGNLDEALAHARSFGYEVDVIYPHERYHRTCSYADNFTYKKETASDVEDEDEIML